MLRQQLQVAYELPHAEPKFQVHESFVAPPFLLNKNNSKEMSITFAVPLPVELLGNVIMKWEGGFI